MRFISILFTLTPRREVLPNLGATVSARKYAALEPAFSPAGLADINRYAHYPDAGDGFCPSREDRNQGNRSSGRVYG